MSNVTQFAAKVEAKAPAVVDTTTYIKFLEGLIAQGAVFGRAKPIAGYMTQDMIIETLKSAGGETETKNTLSVQRALIALDLDEHQTQDIRDRTIEDMGVRWGQKMVHKREVGSSDLVASGVWILKEGTFKEDYMPADASDPANTIFNPNPDAFRVCVTVSAPVTFLMNYGAEFTIDKGGVLAIREKHVAGLVDALENIRRAPAKKRAAVAEAELFTTNDKGQRIAKFDVYGMKPGFLEGNYAAREAKPATKGLAAQAHSWRAVDAAEAAKPAWRRALGI